MDELDNFELEKLQKEEELKTSLESGNNEVIFHKLITYIEFLSKNARYDELLDKLSEYENYNFNQVNKFELLEYKITSFLRLERYNDLLVLLKDENTINLFPEQSKHNVKFYESIAYEALDEVELSIKSLTEIRDNIPRYSLINKYLKLAILYARADEVGKAKDAYEYASMVDFNHKNEMFELVESDLYFKTGNYQEALNSFQSFFLNSSNKYKYLDRYIDIMMALKNYQDAYNFYINYKDKEPIKLSSQNRYRFLLSVRKLLIELNKDDELLELDSILERIKPTYYLKSEIEDNKIISTILKYSLSPITKYDKAKNIVFHFFKLLDNLNLKHLYYVSKDGRDYLVYEYYETRMRERRLDEPYILENHLEYMFKGEKLNSFIDFDLNKFNDKLFKIDLNDSYNDFGFIVVPQSLSLNIIEVLKTSIFSVLLRVKTLSISSNLSDDLLSSLDEVNTGYIRFSGEKIELKNKTANLIFETQNPYISFDEFNNSTRRKNYFVSNLKNEFTDEFTIKDKTKYLRFKVVNKDGQCDAFIEDITKTYKKEREEDRFISHSDLSFYNLNHFKEKVEKMNEAYSILGLTIEIVEETDSLDIRDSKLDSLYKFLIQIVPNTFLYYIGENHFLILIDKIDKRYIESIYNKIKSKEKGLYRYSDSLREKDILAFSSRNLKGKSYNEIKEIIQYGFRHPKRIDELVFLDNEERKEYALYKTFELEILDKINSKKMLVNYTPILDSDKMIHYFLSKFALPHGLDQRVFEEIVTRNNIESKVDTIMIEKVFTEVLEYNEFLRFIIPVHKEAIYNENFIKNITLLLKKYH
nr:hypothetical protein [Gammaproteobacteria bacterium]